MKNLIKVMFMVAFVVALLGVVNAQKANATFITGTIGFGGNAKPVDGSWVIQTDYDAATGLVFSAEVVIDGNTGDYAIFDATSSVTFATDFQFDTLSFTQPLWEATSGLTTATFELASVSIVYQDADFLILSGMGTLYLTGFEATEGEWDFTANNTGGRFVFSSSNAAVPEPGTIALLGMGLVGLIGAGARRKLKKKN